MRLSCLAAILMLPVMGYAESGIIEVEPEVKNTIVTHYSNEKEQSAFANFASRTQDFPTQIVRTQGNVRELQVSCDEVNAEIDNIFISKINYTQYTYNTYVSCSYDVKTKLATSFSINAYFDPLTDSAIEDVKAYIEQYNGHDLFGSSFQLESAKGIIISLNIMAGIKNNANTLNLQRQDRANFAFKSNYDMKTALIADIYQRFYTHDPELILPFISKWLYSGAERIYQGILRRSNYIELQPERIFLMQNDGDIFVSNLRFSYANSCNKYPNKRCL